jgi:hypothetical protein
MGTGAGTVSQVAPLVRFTQSCDQAGTAASLGCSLSWEIVPLCTTLYQLAKVLSLGEQVPAYNYLPKNSSLAGWYKVVPAWQGVIPWRAGMSHLLGQRCRPPVIPRLGVVLPGFLLTP